MSLPHNSTYAEDSRAGMPASSAAGMPPAILRSCESGGGRLCRHWRGGPLQGLKPCFCCCTQRQKPVAGMGAAPPSSPPRCEVDARGGVFFGGASAPHGAARMAASPADRKAVYVHVNTWGCW